MDVNVTAVVFVPWHPKVAAFSGHFGMGFTECHVGQLIDGHLPIERIHDLPQCLPLLAALLRSSHGRSWLVVFG